MNPGLRTHYTFAPKSQPEILSPTFLMSSLVKRLHHLSPCLQSTAHQLRQLRTGAGPNRRRSKSPPFAAKKTDEKSDWWIVDGEMHEIGEHVPPRERFVIPRDNVPNKRRKQLREQFMRRTRLVIKESVSAHSSMPLLLATGRS